jgi:hypothetical protein
MDMIYESSRSSQMPPKQHQHWPHSVESVEQNSLLPQDQATRARIDASNASERVGTREEVADDGASALRTPVQNAGPYFQNKLDATSN